MADISDSQLKEHLELEASSSTFSSSSAADGSATSTKEEVYKELPANNSPLLTVFLLISTMIGSGVLNMPMVFKRSGVFGAFLAFAVSSYFTWLGMVLTTQTAMDTRVLDLAALVKHIFHETGERLMAASIFVGNFGAILSYITIVGGVTADLLDRWKCNNSNGGCGFYTWCVLLMYLIEFPLVLRRFYGHLAWLSVFSIATIILCVCFVLFGGSAYNQQYRHDTVNLFSVPGLISQFGSITYATACNASSIYAFTSLKLENQTIEKWRSVSLHAISGGVALLILMGLSGYLYMRSGVNGDIMESFDVTSADPFKLMLVVHLLLYIPLDFIVMRNMLLVACKIPENTPFVFHFILTFFLLSAAILIVLLLFYGGVSNGTAFNYILGLTGSIALSFVSFIVPASLYLELRGLPYMFILKYFNLQQVKSLSSSSSSYSNEYVTHAQCLFGFGVFIMIAVPIIIFIYGD